MDSESEFPVPNRKESELIKEYFQTESQFMADRGYYATFTKICLRKRAVSVIDKVSRSIFSDAYIPYLAMNYFDRLVSRYKGILTGTAVEGRNDAEKLRLITICCLILAAKMRINNFSVDRFLRALKAMKAMKEVITHQMVKKAEYLILDALHWKLLPVTAFCFLNHYYPYFKEFGGFKRRCINEIIVQAQGEHAFVEYTPSQIALSAFLAASKIAYPSKYDKIQNPSNFHKFDNEEEVKKCLNQMIKLCSRLDIHIEPAESGIDSSCSIVVLGPREETKEVGTSKVKEIQQRNSMAVEGDSSKSKVVVVNSCEEENGTTIINGVRTSKVKEIQEGNGKAAVVGSSGEKENDNGTTIINEIGTSKLKENLQGNSIAAMVNLCAEEEREDGTVIINGVGTSTIQNGDGNGNGKVAVMGSSEEKEKQDGTAIINGVGTSTVKEIQNGDGNGKAAVMGSSEEKEKQGGTAIINGVGTSTVKEIQNGDGNGKAAVVGSSGEKEKENGTAIIKEVGTSKAMGIQHSKSVVVNFCDEENEDEEVGTALIQRRQVVCNTNPSQVQVDMIQCPIDDKDRVEAIIRRSLEKREAVEAEEPQLQMGGSSSEIVDLVEPMNFVLKWMAGANATSALP